MVAIAAIPTPVLTSALVIWRHRSNLQRFLAGTEPRLGQKKPQADPPQT